MNWRWLLFDFIPPAFHVDRATRREIRREVKKDKSLLWSREAFVRTLLMLPALLAAFAVTYWLFDQSIRTRQMRLSIFGYIFLSVASYVIGLIAYAPLRARQTFQAMHRRGYAVCTSCGYPLTHLPETTKVCPECGAARPVLDAEGASSRDDEESLDALPPSGFFQWFGRRRE